MGGVFLFLFACCCWLCCVFCGVFLVFESGTSTRHASSCTRCSEFKTLYKIEFQTVAQWSLIAFPPHIKRSAVMHTTTVIERTKGNIKGADKADVQNQGRLVFVFC